MNIQKMPSLIIKITFFVVFAILIYLVTNYYIFKIINYFPNFDDGWIIQQLTLKNAWNILYRYIVFIVILPILCSLLYKLISSPKMTANGNPKLLLLIIALFLLLISAYAAYELWALYDYDYYTWKLYFDGSSDVECLYKGFIGNFFDLDNTYGLIDGHELIITYHFIINSYLIITSILLALTILLNKAVTYYKKSVAFIIAAFVSATCVLFPSFYIFDSVHAAFVLYSILLLFGAIFGATWYIVCRAIKN